MNKIFNVSPNLEGKSLVFNIIFIAINLVGLIMMAVGYHDSYEGNKTLMLSFAYLFFFLGIVGFYIFQGWKMFSYLARVIVGGLFIVSGLIKANDPKGFAYKLEEYFEDGALAYRVKDMLGWETFSLEFLIQYALAFSIIICVLEIILGVLVIIGGKIKLTSWLMLLMMVFFTLLTWHTKNCDPKTTFRDVDVYSLNDPTAQLKMAQAEENDDIEILKQTESDVRIAEIKKPQCVDDCGCFGDAMKGSVGRSLTPQESFWKDIVLLYLVLIIFITKNVIRPNKNLENLVLLTFSFAFIAFFSWVFTWWFPLLFGAVALILSLWIKRAGGKLFGNDWGVILLVTILSGIFVWSVLAYRPLRDYRPYHVGSVLKDKMSDGEDGIYENVFVYHNKKTGEDKTFTEEEFNASKIWEDKETWEWKETKTKTVKESKMPSITDQFNPKIEVSEMTSTERNFPYINQLLSENRQQYVDVMDKSSGEHYPQLLEDFWIDDWDTADYVIGDTIMQLSESFTEVSMLDFILEEEKIIVLISRSIESGNFSRIHRLKEIAENASEEEVPMIMISTAEKEEVIAFREKYELDIPTFMNDETELKAMTRSNPTLMVIENGVITGKFAFRATPSWKWIKENLLNN